jgi:topoisomerase-4 subunit A
VLIKRFKPDEEQADYILETRLPLAQRLKKNQFREAREEIEEERRRSMPWARGA